VGVGGSGMSPLAVILADRGLRITGSDRDHDRGRAAGLFAALRAAGVELVPQDGSGVRAGPPDAVVVSGAVESAVADVAAAREAGIPVRRRAEVLAELLGGGRSVAVAGTSGKSTVTAMIAWILREAGAAPGFLGGAPLTAPADGSSVPGRAPGPGAWSGASDLMVAEADESDGTLTLYRPRVGVVINLSHDHRALEDLLRQFTAFASAVEDCLVVHADPARLAGWEIPAGPPRVTFGTDAGADVRAEAVALEPDGSRFRIAGAAFRLPLPGRFNVENALAAVAAARALGVEDAVSSRALAGFPGLSRRMERVGRARGVTVIDDFAHNPDKVAAALEALRAGGRRLRLVFQLHGFGPARMHRRGLVGAFAAGLGPGDRLYLMPIYYAGGTVSRDVSADDYLADLRAEGVEARASGPREDLARRVVADCEAGDVAAVMGARDPSLPVLAREILAALGE
jgi:UDP-N-acetylmuramate--alanine ligase